MTPMISLTTSAANGGDVITRQLVSTEDCKYYTITHTHTHTHIYIYIYMLFKHM